MKNLLSLFVVVFVLIGCATATRTTATRDELNVRFTILHDQPAAAAFQKAEVALAVDYNDLPRVLKLRQPESGTLILKPLVSYQVGALGQMQFAPYNLKIVVANPITMSFELGPEQTSGWNSYPPVTEIPKIHQHFKSIAESVAKSVGGTVE